MLTGEWDLTMNTPIGTLRARYRFDRTGDGFTGTATNESETVPLMDVVVAGDSRVTWRQRVTRPLRLNLDFDVTVAGDTMTGHSRAGRLPRTVVTGRRITVGPQPSG